MKIREDFVYLHIDYASTMDDLELPIWKIEEVMLRAHFFAKHSSDVDAVIEILYYLEIYYREKPEHKAKALKI